MGVGMTVEKESDVFEALRAKWTRLLSGGDVDPSDSDIASRVHGITEEAEAYWRSMTAGDPVGSLWSDLDLSAASRHLTSASRRIALMAAASRMPTSKLSDNPVLRAELRQALEDLYDRHFNESIAARDNWWDWEIGTPLAIADTLILLHDDLTEELLACYVRAIVHFQSPTIFTGANLVWVNTVTALLGILAKDADMLEDARKRLAPLFRWSDRGDGFYRDGSFVQHDYYAYTGGYGISLIVNLSRLVFLLDGTPWDFDAADKRMIERWLREAYAPLMYRGVVMDMVRGREISREQSQDRAIGRLLIEAVATVATAESFPGVRMLAQTAKQWIGEQALYGGGFGNSSVFVIAAAKALTEDDTIAPSEESAGFYLYGGMDRVVHRRPGYAFAVSMSSSRIGNFESINEENLRGWYTGDGMTYLYNGDAGQYGGDYWPTVHAYRLPGTTVDTVVREDGSGSGYLSGESWSGGTGIGSVAGEELLLRNRAGQDGENCGERCLYGVAGMSLHAWNSNLRANKSWFMFDEEIVALGSGISCPGQHEGIGWDGGARRTETIVDNRRLSGSGEWRLSVDDEEKAPGAGWAETMPGTVWAHLAGDDSGSDIGYYFPDGAVLDGLREKRADRWRSLNSRSVSDREAIQPYLTLWLDHGTSPTDAAYAYVLLPGKTVRETADYAKHPRIKILANTDRVHAVRHLALHAVGANFWTDGSNEISIDGQPYLSCDRQASIMTLERDGRLELSVADPTQSCAELAWIEVNRAAAAIEYADDRIEVLQLSPSIRLAVRTEGALGASIRASFALSANTSD